MSETGNVTAPILAALTKAGYFCMRLNSGMAKIGRHYVKLCPKGTADILLCPPFQPCVWIETKTEKGHTNPEQVKAQAEFAFRVEALGHSYLRATKLDDVLAVLNSRKEAL